MITSREFIKIIFLPILSSLIHITSPKIVVDVKIIFLIKFSIGILDQRPSKAVVEKQPVEVVKYHDILLLIKIFTKFDQSENLQMLKRLHFCYLLWNFSAQVVVA